FSSSTVPRLTSHYTYRQKPGMVAATPGGWGGRTPAPAPGPVRSGHCDTGGREAFRVAQLSRGQPEAAHLPAAEPCQPAPPAVRVPASPGADRCQQGGARAAVAVRAAAPQVDVVTLGQLLQGAHLLAPLAQPQQSPCVAPVADLGTAPHPSVCTH